MDKFPAFSLGETVDLGGPRLTLKLLSTATERLNEC